MEGDQRRGQAAEAGRACGSGSGSVRADARQHRPPARDPPTRLRAEVGAAPQALSQCTQAASVVGAAVQRASRSSQVQAKA